MLFPKRMEWARIRAYVTGTVDGIVPENRILRARGARAFRMRSEHMPRTNSNPKKRTAEVSVADLPSERLGQQSEVFRANK
jgi:hypothetical protein